MNAPRTCTGVPARVDRLKAIGNGQVPSVAAAAVRALLARFDDQPYSLTPNP